MKFHEKETVLVYANNEGVKYDSFRGALLESADNEKDLLVDIINLDDRTILSVYSHSIRLDDAV